MGGRYGITLNSEDEITGEVLDTIMAEAAKTIEAKQDMREVAIASYDRAWVYANRGEHKKVVSDYSSAIK